MIWCEHCRESYELDHYRLMPNDMGKYHLTGKQYGPTGYSMFIEEQLKEAIAEIRKQHGQYTARQPGLECTCKWCKND